MNFWVMYSAWQLNILNWFINILPNADQSILQTISTAWSQFLYYILLANWVLPLNLLFSTLIKVIDIELYIWSFQVSRYIIRITTFGLIKI
jgi:hypothetical protein